MEHCGLTEYLFAHDKFFHCLIIEVVLIFFIQIIDNFNHGVSLKFIGDIFLNKLLVLVICFSVKIIDFLTISSELIYEIICGFYVFESACEIFLLGEKYGLPLPPKLKELIEKYIVKVGADDGKA